MNRLLLDDKPLIVLPSLACEYGLNEAIVLYQLHDWLQESKNIHDGYTWVYSTYTDWVKQFPFWSERTIRRTIAKLEARKVIVTNNFNTKKSDRTKWYRIDYKQLNLLAIPHGRSDQFIQTKVPVDVVTSILDSGNDVKRNGMPIPVTAVPHISTKNDVRTIANRFIQLRQAGFNLTPLDYNGINKILTHGIAVENVLKWIEECFSKYKPKHSRDKIRSFNYCVPYMLDRHSESLRATENKGIKVKRKYNERDFDLDD
jgi:hypothetical protein